MIQPGLRLRHIVFCGPSRPFASLTFGPGLNVIYGASEVGKSFVAEAIDFMLGGRPPLRDIPERIGYDRILLGMETLAGEQFTLLRSVDGGAFRAYPGLHVEPPTEVSEGDAVELSDQHSDKNASNLSTYLLQRCGLEGKRLRKNKHGVTNSLSFRNLARLLIVDETAIMAQRSPLSDGNPVSDTTNFSAFKLLLTGLDDSSLVANKPKAAEDQSRDAQLELLDQMIDGYYERLAELTKDPEDLEDQLSRLDGTIAQHSNQLATSEAEYRRIADRRRELRKKLEEGRDRRAEIDGLIERFTLLDRHYVSDIARLKGLEEGGTLFDVLGQAPCPLCGALPAEHRKDTDCDGNVEAVVSAARSEISKIQILRAELSDTLRDLNREATGFDKRLPKVEHEVNSLSRGIEELISPQLTKLRASYSVFVDKRSVVKEALSVYRSIKDAEERRLKIANNQDGQGAAAVAEGDLSTVVAEEFAQQVETVLKEWHFPGAERVFFDPKSRDLIIAGKARTARGKGLRAITHAAFSVGLLQFCKQKETPHPSFLVLDTPLRSYREPDGQDDDLSGTDLDARFYDYLAAFGEDRQVIVIENTNPPVSITKRDQSILFTKNPHQGRYGFFPPAGEAPASPATSEVGTE
jgi:hypothetical protein